MVAALVPQSRVGRKSRRPQHPFQVHHRPWQIQPILCAPVLPGETLKNILFQSRAVTDPIRNPLVGWWIEYYFFYVKHRDLAARDLLTSMMLDISITTASLNAVARPHTYHRNGTVDWPQLCLDRVVETYFRDEDEIGTTYMIGSLPAAHINRQDITDSLVREDAWGAAQDVGITVGVDDIVTASEMDSAMRTWEFLRANKLTSASYEDFLASYGVARKVEDDHRPELIRYFREWSYPTNTVEPTTGAPSTAVSWSVAERADKDRFFREPGFIFGCTCARPKVYLANQQSLLVNEMDRAIRWLPAILNDDPYSSLVQFLAGDANGPLTGATDGYWFDLKDLFLYGEQFANILPGTAGFSKVILPKPDIINKRFADSTDADALFKNAAPANLVKQDGIVNLDILSVMQDTTPQGIQG